LQGLMTARRKAGRRAGLSSKGSTSVGPMPALIADLRRRGRGWVWARPAPRNWVAIYTPHVNQPPYVARRTHLCRRKGRGPWERGLEGSSRRIQSPGRLHQSCPLRLRWVNTCQRRECGIIRRLISTSRETAEDLAYRLGSPSARCPPGFGAVAGPKSRLSSRRGL
jgi:hypothetical protein